MARSRSESECEMCMSPADFPSSASPVEPGVNQRGPPRKAKYSLVTDSDE